MTEETRRREINEAIRAGERALQSLRSAEQELSSARNWGFFDMLGGGFITDMIKHSRINDASSYIDRAKTDLSVFEKELRDIPEYGELNVDIGSFLSFADFFFDGLVVDYLVQSRINEARDRVQEAIRKVDGLLAGLRRQA